MKKNIIKLILFIFLVVVFIVIIQNHSINDRKGVISSQTLLSMFDNKGLTDNKKYPSVYKENVYFTEQDDTDTSAKIILNSIIPNLGAILIYGDANLPDEDAFVITFFGDGFNNEEQTNFYKRVCGYAKLLVECSPWDEFKDEIKIYAIATISKDSGCRGDSANSFEKAKADTRETYFSSHFWTNEIQRLLTINNKGRLNALKSKYKPETDSSIVLVNTFIYGGAGDGDIASSSLCYDAYDIIMHELGHSVGQLADEYYELDYFFPIEAPNQTMEGNPEKVKWKRFLGKNNITANILYQNSDGTKICYRPSNKCKMGSQYSEYCEVCKEAIRKAICKKSNVTKLFLQTYGDEINIFNGNINLSEYFILRKANEELIGSDIKEEITITYFDIEGNMLEELPKVPGKYVIEASYAGNDRFDSCTLRQTIKISNVFE